MSIEMSLYLADVIPKLGLFITIIGIILGVGTLIVYCNNVDYFPDIKFFKYGLVAGAFTLLSAIGLMFPNSNTMNKILIASLAKEVQNNPKVQAIEDRLYNIIDGKLKEIENNK